jgi:hypothetical protein
MAKRLPGVQSILQVYAVIAVLLAGWTITAFLWKLSAWLLLLNLGEILAIFAYAMAANLLESLLLMGILLLLSVLLPASFLRDRFALRGSLLAMGWIGALMAFVGVHMQMGLQNRTLLWAAPLVVFLVTAFLLHSSSRIVHRVHSGILWISDRLIVFLFLLLPLFLFSSAYAIVRNAL